MDSFDYPFWRDLVQERTGLWFGPALAGLLESGLRERAGELRLRSLADYRRRLDEQPAEWDALGDALAVREGRFFRQPEVFAALEAWLLPQLVRRAVVAGRRALRVWSAGCGAGEELYSVAMLVLEAVRLPDRWQLDLLGTDRSARSVELARAGRYHRNKLEAVSPTRLERWFEPPEPDGQTRAVGAELRQRCAFQRHDLRSAVPDGAPSDLILCQNVLYYLAPDVVPAAFERLVGALAPGGVLIVGAPEVTLLETGAGGQRHDRVRSIRIGTARALCKDGEA